MKKYYPFIIYLMISFSIPVITRQFLVTDTVIENKIESNELNQVVPLDIDKVKLSKTYHYFIEMIIVLIDFIIVFGLIIGLLKAYGENYKSFEILNILSRGYIILLLGYLVKVLYFTLLDDFSIDHFDNYSILSLADFYNFDDMNEFKYLMLSNYNLFRLSSLIYILYSIYILTNRNMKVIIYLSLIIGSLFFLIPLIGL
ncbi:MAG: hypothetical protein ACQETL_03155 [Bacteroidota bacterium]